MLNLLLEEATEKTAEVTNGVDTGAVGEVANAGYSTFIGIVNVILPIVIGVILVLGLFYGISLAIKYAKAEEDEDKKKAKGSLINVVVGCLIAIVFVAVIEIILNGDYIRSLFTKNGISTTISDVTTKAAETTKGA